MMAEHRTTFLDPLWRRVALVAFCFAWSAWEFWNGASGWGMIVGVMAIYAVWTYLYDYRRARPPSPAAGDGDQP
jgi:hypothetical protein